MIKFILKYLNEFLIKYQNVSNVKSENQQNTHNNNLIENSKTTIVRFIQNEPKTRCSEIEMNNTVLNDFTFKTFCNCKKGCKNKLCPCKKSNQRCSSNCHNSILCDNLISIV